MKNISGVVRHLTALFLYTAPMQYTSTCCTFFSTFFLRLKDNDRQNVSRKMESNTGPLA